MSDKLRYRSLRGMPDLLPEDMAVMRWAEDKAREVFRLFGYSEIKTPHLEETEVFTRSIGEDTDIVEKEMYSFTDRGGKNISLRPEGTASIIRAYIEHGWHNTKGLVRLFYSGPMFRGERPQKGRLRQFNQIGAEIIGASDPYIDAEIILNLNVLLRALNVKNSTILLNSLGCAKDRSAYQKDLSAYLAGKSVRLCESCGKRLKTNVLRVLDCKRKECKDVVKDAPGVIGYLCKKCVTDYTSLKTILKEMKVPFTEKKDLVRGLDYYTGTIFEVTHPSLGSQDAIAAGGRYDGLSKQMGGPDTGATGYAIGVERLMLTVDRKKIQPHAPEVLVIAVDEAAAGYAFKAANEFRAENIPADMDLSGRSFKGQLRRAHKEGRRYVALVGEKEMKDGKITLKDMETGGQDTISLSEAIERVK